MTKIEQLYSQWQTMQPLKQEDQSRLNQKFMLEFNYNSNHIEGNTLTYGQTEFLLLFGKTVDVASMKDLEDMKASNVGLKMMQEEAKSERPLTEYFIRQLHKTILREDYEEHRSRDGYSFHYTIHAGIYKTRPNMRDTHNPQILEYVSHAGSMWYNCELNSPQRPRLVKMVITKTFYITFFDDHYFVDGILNKNFPYGKYPSEEEKREIVSQFKKDILTTLKDKL